MENETKKKSVLKKILIVLGIIAGAVLGAFGIYYLGKSNAVKEVLSSDGITELKENAAMDAIDDYRESVVACIEHGDFASKFTDNDGVTKYITYTMSETKPDWWDNDLTKHFDLAEEVVKF